MYCIISMQINGEDFDSLILENKVLSGLYFDEDSALCFFYEWRKLNARSLGPVSNSMKLHRPETDSTYANNSYKFLWEFENSYDDVTGKADLQIDYVFTEKGVLIHIEIEDRDSGDNIILQGFQFAEERVEDEKSLISSLSSIREMTNSWRRTVQQSVNINKVSVPGKGFIPCS